MQLCRFLKSRSTTFLTCFHQHQGVSQPQQNSYQLRNDWELWIPFPFMAASSSIIYGYLMIFMHIYGSFITVVTKIPSRAARLRRWAWLCGAMKHRFDLYVRYTIEIDLPNPITTLEGLNGHLICTHFITIAQLNVMSHATSWHWTLLVGPCGSHRLSRAIYINEARVSPNFLKFVYTFPGLFPFFSAVASFILIQSNSPI